MDRSPPAIPSVGAQVSSGWHGCRAVVRRHGGHVLGRHVPTASGDSTLRRFLTTSAIPTSASARERLDQDAVLSRLLVVNDGASTGVGIPRDGAESAGPVDVVCRRGGASGTFATTSASTLGTAVSSRLSRSLVCTVSGRARRSPLPEGMPYVTESPWSCQHSVGRSRSTDVLRGVRAMSRRRMRCSRSSVLMILRAVLSPRSGARIVDVVNPAICRRFIRAAGCRDGRHGGPG